MLKNETAKFLYETYAKNLPIIDFHNHLSMKDLSEDRQFENLAELWLQSDPYKHRLMRIMGIEERFITGDASPYEKFEKFCAVFPDLAGTPVYDWSRMELSSIFGIHLLPSEATAHEIYEAAGALLQKKEYSMQGILSRFHIEYQSPVATLREDLAPFQKAGVAPSLRGDDLLAADAPPDLSDRLNAFEAAGCRFADHSLDTGFFESGNTGRLIALAKEYTKRSWTLLLHLGALRKTSSRLASLAGPAGGYAAAGSGISIEGLTSLLNQMEEEDALPKTILFPLNLQDQAALAILEGSFSQDGVAGKVQLGPAWWWCDHAFGIRHSLDCISSFGVLSQFIGMTTDSRSPLSFIRHDYFRRFLCQWISEQDWGLTPEQLGAIIRKVCYENAKRRIQNVSK